MKKILIVDPDAASTERLSGLLKPLPCTIDHTPFVLSVRTIISLKPDLILAHETGDGAAISLCKKVKNTPAVCSVPFVIVSELIYTRHKAKECQADHWFRMPEETPALLAFIDRTLAEQSGSPSEK